MLSSHVLIACDVDIRFPQNVRACLTLPHSFDINSPQLKTQLSSHLFPKAVT
jgi:hypothetical protein